MKPLPIAIFTKDRTGCAVATATALLDNLGCTGYEPRYILCDDRSVRGHVEAVVDVFRQRGVEPEVLRTDDRHYGLGASMNNGLRRAFEVSDKCFRMEDDWLLKRQFDIGPYADAMDELQIGLMRFGIMQRLPQELRPLGRGIAAVQPIPQKRRIFAFNNQLGIVSRRVHDLLGWYPENVGAPIVEEALASRYNDLTRNGMLPPYVGWPQGWATNSFYSDKNAFDHMGASIVGHDKLYAVPPKYRKYNDPAHSAELRRRVLELD